MVSKTGKTQVANNSIGIYGNMQYEQLSKIPLYIYKACCTVVGYTPIRFEDNISIIISPCLNKSRTESRKDIWQQWDYCWFRFTRGNRHITRGNRHLRTVMFGNARLRAVFSMTRFRVRQKRIRRCHCTASASQVCGRFAHKDDPLKVSAGWPAPTISPMSCVKYQIIVYTCIIIIVSSVLFFLPYPKYDFAKTLYAFFPQMYV